MTGWNVAKTGIGMILGLGAFCAMCVPAAGDAAGPIIAQAYARNGPLTAYSFHLNVAMAMRHFPWLHFHMRGDGRYDRNGRYQVHFTHMPFFAKSFDTLDLSLFSPSLWSEHYVVTRVSKCDTSAVFDLQDRAGGKGGKNALSKAVATVDARTGLRELDMHYANGGEIKIDLTTSDSSGYLLPTVADAQIDMPGMALSAQAGFTNYTVQTGDGGR
ncbi:MAG TPA: hypothetical protein VIG51_10685 [Candidatus Baltobacteraceae bacterium]|jgi:hypothetical protein